jgi:lysophospholipase L1-like esterase
MNNPTIDMPSILKSFTMIQVRFCILLSVLLTAGVASAADGSNMLLANQARLEHPAITAAQYAPIGDAVLQLNSDNPHEGNMSLRVRPGRSNTLENNYGTSTVAGFCQKEYWYERNEHKWTTSEYNTGPYVVSLYVRGASPVKLGFHTNSGIDVERQYDISAEKWQRIVLTLTASKPFQKATISVSAKHSHGPSAGFWIDQVQWEKGEQASAFNARAMPTKRPSIDSSQFLWRKGDRVVCLGDSMTDWTPGYVRVLQERVKKKYPDRGIVIIGAGFGGNTFAAMLKRAAQDVIAQEPDWILLNGGLNDVGNQADFPVEATRKSLESLVELLRNSTMAQIIVVGTTPYLGRADLAPAITRVNRIVGEVATKNKLMLIPLEKDFIQANNGGEKLYFNDPHFNLKGFTIMAEHILNAVHF